MVRETIRRSYSSGAKAIRNPMKAFRHLRMRSESVVSTAWRCRSLPRQLEVLERLRATDEWLLVVLDACRYDALRRVGPQYLRGGFSRLRSAGRDTFEYVRECWPAQYPDVTYVSGAVPVNSRADGLPDERSKRLYGGYRPPEHIGRIVDVWEADWDPSLGVVPPEAVTREALSYADESQLVVHYFQPHAPYIGRPTELGHTNDVSAGPTSGGTVEPADKPLWERVEAGVISDGRLRACYDGNLHRAMRSVHRLVTELDHDRVVVMADHGEALGEFGVYGHPRWCHHPEVRLVPWLDVEDPVDPDRIAVPEARSEGTPGSRSEGTPDAAEADVEQRLRELGYLD